MCFSEHALTESRNGLLVDFKIAEANGTAERVVALDRLEEHVRSERATVAGICAPGGRSGCSCGPDHGVQKWRGAAEWTRRPRTARCRARSRGSRRGLP
jgi:hypothetical protein